MELVPLRPRLPNVHDCCCCCVFCRRRHCCSRSRRTAAADTASPGRCRPGLSDVGVDGSTGSSWKEERDSTRKKEAVAEEGETDELIVQFEIGPGRGFLLSTIFVPVLPPAIMMRLTPRTRPTSRPTWRDAAIQCSMQYSTIGWPPQSFPFYFTHLDDFRKMTKLSLPLSPHAQAR